MNSGNYSFQNNPNHYPPDYPHGSVPRKKRKGRFLFWVVIAVVILGLAFLASIALAFKFYATSKKVIDNGQNTTFVQSLKDITSSDRKTLRGEANGRINILLVGLAGKNYPGANLTDSIIVASIDPKTYQTALLSIPRDLYVQIPNTNSFTKINALYARSQDSDASGISGINDLKQVIGDITGLNINYYIALDFDGFKQIINELGGVKIQVLKDLHDERYPGPNYSYETFDLKQGLYTLDGEIALKYARTRHDEDGDFGRAFRQQQILEAARSKAFSLGTILNIPEINKMLDTLGEHLRTDIPLDEVNSFIDLIGKVDAHTTVNKVLDAGKADSVMAVSHVSLGGVQAFILVPRTGNYDETRDIAKNIFDLNVLALKKKEIASEDASVAIVNASGAGEFDTKLQNLLNKLGYNAKSAKTTTANSLPQNIKSNSVVYDIVKTKPFSLEDLSKKLGAKISEDVPTSFSAACLGADLCLVAGSDLAASANFEENTTADLEQGYDKQSTDEKTYIDLLKKGSSVKF